MAKKFDKDSFSGTLIVVLAVSLICSVIVAGAVVGLKPVQEKQKVQDKQSYILSVAGLLDKKYRHQQNLCRPHRTARGRFGDRRICERRTERL